MAGERRGGANARFCSQIGCRCSCRGRPVGRHDFGAHLRRGGRLRRLAWRRLWRLSWRLAFGGFGGRGFGFPGRGYGYGGYGYGGYGYGGWWPGFATGALLGAAATYPYWGGYYGYPYYGYGYGYPYYGVGYGYGYPYAAAGYGYGYGNGNGNGNGCWVYRRTYNRYGHYIGRRLVNVCY